MMSFLKKYKNLLLGFLILVLLLGFNSVSLAQTTTVTTAPAIKVTGEAIANCGYLDFGCELKAFLFNLSIGILKFLGVGILTWVSWFFDWIIGYSMKYSLNAVPGVVIGWQVLKSLANVAIIFSLLFSVIPVVFKIGESSITKKIFTIVVTAILINFSFLITSFVVDIGNVFASFFYTGMTGYAPGQGSLSASAMAATDILNLFDLRSKGINPGNMSIWDLITIIFAVYFFVFFLILIFATLAILVLIREIYIWFLAMLAPAAFLGYGISKMKKWWDQWWDKLIRWTFFLPGAILFLLIALTVMDGIIKCQGGAQGCLANDPTLQAYNQQSSSAGVLNQVVQPSLFFQFMLVIGLLAGSVIAANASGINIAKYVGGAMTMVAGGMVAGAATSVLSRTGVRERLSAVGGKWTKEGAEKGGPIGGIQARIGRMVGQAGQFETASERKKGESLAGELKRDPNAFAGMTGTQKALATRYALNNKDSEVIAKIGSTKQGQEILGKQYDRMTPAQKKVMEETLPHIVIDKKNIKENAKEVGDIITRALENGKVSWEQLLKEPEKGGASPEARQKILDKVMSTPEYAGSALYGANRTNRRALLEATKQESMAKVAPIQVSIQNNNIPVKEIEGKLAEVMANPVIAANCVAEYRGVLSDLRERRAKEKEQRNQSRQSVGPISSDSGTVEDEESEEEDVKTGGME